MVSGIGFIGGGLIFVRRDIVRGLTTAATVWLAAGSAWPPAPGLPLLAIGDDGRPFLISVGFPPLARVLVRVRAGPSRCCGWTTSTARACCAASSSTCTEQGWAVHGVEVDREGTTDEGHRVASVTLTLAGRGELVALAAEVAQLPGVRTARPVPRTPLDEE